MHKGDRGPCFGASCDMCLLYKGDSETDRVLASDITESGGDAAKYGIANWHYYNGRTDEAKAHFEDIVATGGWSSFGLIAAESDLARKF